MSAPAAVRPAGRGEPGASPAPVRRRRRFSLSDKFVPVFATLAFVYLMVPVAYTVAFSFNQAGRRNLVWQGFTLDNWRNPCGAPQVCEAFVNSIQVGLIATVVATALGTLIAIALVRYKFRGRTLANLLIFLPMSTPARTARWRRAPPGTCP